MHQPRRLKSDTHQSRTASPLSPRNPPGDTLITALAAMLRQKSGNISGNISGHQSLPPSLHGPFLQGKRTGGLGITAHFARVKNEKIRDSDKKWNKCRI